MASVSGPQALRSAVGNKLGEAAQYCCDLQQADQPEFNKHWDPRRSVVAFLHSAPGIVPVIETFAKHRQQRGDFQRWRNGWENQRLTADELTVWLLMRDERTAQEHGEGAGLTSIWIPITQGLIPTVTDKGMVMATPRQPDGPSKQAMRFRAYPGRRVSEVCAQYLELCHRFWRDFQADHQHLF
jgi:hypothetical protein